jgi:hypothetical protein
MVYTVQSFYDLTTKIIPHFDKYPLLSQKRNDYLLFKQIISLLNINTQASDEGLQEIINIRASINKGLSNKLLENFPKTIPVSKPEVIDNYKINPN